MALLLLHSVASHTFSNDDFTLPTVQLGYLKVKDFHDFWGVNYAFCLQ